MFSVLSINDKGMKEEAQSRFERQKKGLCHVCEVPAPGGCCEKHNMECGLCRGEGSIGKPIWQAFYGKKYEHRTLSKSVSKETEALKEWILDQLDIIDTHGCESCWSDSHHCTCQADKQKMRQDFLRELTNKL